MLSESQREQVLGKLREVVDPKGTGRGGKITAATTLRDDLGLDSLAALELVMELEEAFSIRLDPEELRGLRTVGDLLGYLDVRVGGGGAGAPGATAEVAAELSAGAGSSAGSATPG